MMERTPAMNLVSTKLLKRIKWAVGSILFPLLMVMSSNALFADQIIVTGGRNYEDVTITGATYEQVQFKLPGVSTSQKVDADKVLQLVFSRESSSLARGRGAFEKGDWETASNSFQSAKSMGDALKKSSAMYMHGLALLRWGDTDASKYAAAVDVLNAYLTEFEGKKDFYVPHARMALSEAHRKAGNYSEAESALANLASGNLGRRWVLGARLGKAQSLLAPREVAPEQRRILIGFW